MYRHLLILPDGTDLFSGAEQENSGQSVTVTQAANDGEEIMAFMKDASIADILKKEQYWGCDLSFLLEEVEKWNTLMAEQGMEAAFKEVLK